MKFLDGYAEQAYALLRIVAGLMFLAHGVQKFFNFPTAFPMPLNPMLSAAGAIELVAGGLIVIGLFTRPAAFVASGMAAVGYWMVHGSKDIFPIVNGARRSRSIASSSCSSRPAARASGASTRRADNRAGKDRGQPLRAAPSCGLHMREGRDQSVFVLVSISFFASAIALAVVSFLS